MDNQNNLNEIIKIREHWLKICVIALFSLIGGLFLTLFIIKLFSVEFKINIIDFNYSDFISILLAFFSVGLAVAFYLKTTETSNKFYDNTYKFTKDFSEILGRIEVKFSEKLEHIDNASIGISDKIEKLKYPQQPTEASSDNKKIEKEKIDAQKESDKVINDLVDQLGKTSEEKNHLRTKLKNAEEKLIQKSIESLRQKITLESLRDKFEINNLPNQIVKFTATQIIPILGHEALRLPTQALNDKFQSIKNRLPKAYIADLQLHKLIDKEDNLTNKGYLFIKELAKNKE
ncbi:MAG: hypothetical protein WCP93_04180 [Candidatus Berkelbacteria bacterium]